MVLKKKLSNICYIIILYFTNIPFYILLIFLYFTNICILLIYLLFMFYFHMSLPFLISFGLIKCFTVSHFLLLNYILKSFLVVSLELKIFILTYYNPLQIITFTTWLIPIKLSGLLNSIYFAPIIPVITMTFTSIKLKLLRVPQLLFCV